MAVVELCLSFFCGVGGLALAVRLCGGGVVRVGVRWGAGGGEDREEC